MLVMGGLMLRVIKGCRVCYWIRLNLIKGDYWALLEVCRLCVIANFSFQCSYFNYLNNALLYLL